MKIEWRVTTEDREALKKFKTIREWLRQVRIHGTKSKSTEKNYLGSMVRFCRYVGRDPDQLIDEAKAHVDAGEKKYAEKLVLDFFDFVETDLGRSRGTARTIYGALRGLYRTHEILFYEKTPPEQIEEITKPPFKEDVIKVLKQCDARERFIITGIGQTGMRREDFATLVYGDAQRDYEAGADRLYIEKQSKKRKIWFNVFLGKQSTEALRIYLEERKREGEIFTDSTPLIIKKKPGGRKTWAPGERVEPIKPTALTRIVKEAGDRVNVYLRPHMLRKFFRTQASPNIGHEAAMKMGAWKLPGVAKSYYLPSREECLKLYLLIEPAVTFAEVPKAAIMAQRDMAKRFLKEVFGLDPADLLRKERVSRKGKMTAEDETDFLLTHLSRMWKRERRMRNGGEPIGGGLSFDQRMSRMLSDLIVNTLTDAKKRLENE